MRDRLEGVVPVGLRANPEFQSALVRLLLWVFAFGYLAFAQWSGYYQISLEPFLALFLGFLVIFVALMVSVLRQPVSQPRRYLSLVVDVTATSLAIFLTHDAISPFYLLYIWIFVSYGTRYGKQLLAAASIMSLTAYNLVLVILGEWQRHGFEAFFFLLLLGVLPVYQYSLLRQVHRARREAERASRAKSDFLANMNHELRTPLSGVIGMAHLLETTELDSEQREYIRSLSSSAHILRALIGDVLDLSRIEAGRLELEAQPFAPRETLHRVTRALSAQVLDQGLELIVRIDPRLPEQLVGDELRLTQILFNLVGNAVKFTVRGHVLVRVGVAPAGAGLALPHVLLEVIDTGVGIPRDKLGNIFDSFWQADASVGRRFGGSGLGTTIARDLSRLMGGTIAVDSTPGEGTTFCVRLPLLPAAFEVPEPGPVAVGTARALVFETDAAATDLCRDSLQHLGIEAVCVSRVPQVANALAVGEGVDLVLVGDSPQGLNLAGVIDEIRARFGRVPVLVAAYPGRTDGGSEPLCRIGKPLLSDTLEQAIGQLLRGELGTPATAPGAPSNTAPAARVETAEVLVAEDNPIGAKVLATLLSQAGCRVTLVRNGREALREAERGGFRVAFVDLQMPEVDGLAFVRALRDREQGARLPVVALTAHASDEMRKRCLAAGMDEFLVKPVAPDELATVLARYAVA